MILLVSASPVAERVGAVLQERLGETVQQVESMKRARTATRLQSCAAVVLDESSVDAESVFDAVGADVAVLVSANLAIHDGERVARDVKAALRRVERERAAASDWARRQMCAKVNQPLTELLVGTELALEAPDLPTARERMTRVLAAVQRLREVLQD